MLNFTPPIVYFIFGFILTCLPLHVVMGKDFTSRPSNTEFAQDRILVKFRESETESGIVTALAKSMDVPAWLSSRGRFFDTTVIQVKDALVDIPEIITAIKQWPDVEYAEPDYLINAQLLPNDHNFSEQWSLHNDGSTGGSPGADINMTDAWDLTTGNTDSVIALLDTGVDYNHPDLSTNMWRNPIELTGRPGFDDDGNGFIDDIYGINAISNTGNPRDDNGHGTHCAGILGAIGNNHRGITGINWQTKIMALKMLDSFGVGSASTAIKALNYAVEMKREHNVNIKVASNSWGGGGFSLSLRNAVKKATEEGILFVAAAGNDGQNNDVIPFYPASYDLPSIISVASTDFDDHKSSFSNYGFNSVDLAAPGRDILSTLPGNSYGRKSGTSMATPHVAGVAAMLANFEPDFSPLDIKSNLMDSVDTITDLKSKVISGGRLNAYGALTCDPHDARLRPSLPADFKIIRGIPQTLYLTASACAPLPGYAVTVKFDNGDIPIALFDNGIAPDVTADDGIYTGIWIPQGLRNTTVSFIFEDGLSISEELVSGTVIPDTNYVVTDQAQYNWHDIKNSGIKIDFTSQNISNPIFFNFNYFGTEYDRLFISRNGVISFDGSSVLSTNSSIPSYNPEGSNTFIAPYWDSINPTTEKVYYTISGAAPNRQLTIQWDDFQIQAAPSRGKMQVILFERTKSVLFQYLTTSFRNSSIDYGASATIGLQASDKHGILYSFNRRSINDRKAILWIPESEYGFSINNSTVEEGNSGTKNIVFNVSLPGPSTKLTMVKYATLNESATANSDFISRSGTLSFAPGETTKTISVQVIGDTMQESDETFIVNLYDPDGAYIIESQAQGIITDDDTIRVHVSDISRLEGNSGFRAIDVNVSLNKICGCFITLRYATANGTASVENQDYLQARGSLTFRPNQTRQTIRLFVRGDKFSEADENFYIEFSDVKNAITAKNIVTVTILNDD